VVNQYSLLDPSITDPLSQFDTDEQSPVQMAANLPPSAMTDTAGVAQVMNNLGIQPSVTRAREQSADRVGEESTASAGEKILRTAATVLGTPFRAIGAVDYTLRRLTGGISSPEEALVRDSNVVNALSQASPDLNSAIPPQLRETIEKYSSGRTTAGGMSPKSGGLPLSDIGEQWLSVFTGDTNTAVRKAQEMFGLRQSIMGKQNLPQVLVEVQKQKKEAAEARKAELEAATKPLFLQQDAEKNDLSLQAQRETVRRWPEEVGVNLDFKRAQARKMSVDTNRAIQYPPGYRPPQAGDVTEADRELERRIAAAVKLWDQARGMLTPEQAGQRFGLEGTIVADRVKGQQPGAGLAGAQRPDVQKRHEDRQRSALQIKALAIATNTKLSDEQKRAALAAIPGLDPGEAKSGGWLGTSFGSTTTFSPKMKPMDESPSATGTTGPAHDASTPAPLPSPVDTSTVEREPGAPAVSPQRPHPPTVYPPADNRLGLTPEQADIYQKFQDGKIDRKTASRMLAAAGMNKSRKLAAK